jgi:hypothetical protein
MAVNARSARYARGRAGREPLSCLYRCRSTVSCRAPRTWRVRLGSGAVDSIPARKERRRGTTGALSARGSSLLCSGEPEPGSSESLVKAGSFVAVWTRRRECAAPCRACSSTAAPLGDRTVLETSRRRFRPYFQVSNRAHGPLSAGVSCHWATVNGTLCVYGASRCSPRESASGHRAFTMTSWLALRLRQAKCVRP